MNPQKITDRFGRLLRPQAWKQNGPILEEVDR